MSIRPVDDYPLRLLETLRYLASDRRDDPQVVVLTPGRFNSAYYEHAFLAQQMGVELVEPQDLVVREGYVQMRTTEGFKRVDVIYRRVSDDFLDPMMFRPESLLGVPGVMEVFLNGRVALANAPGTGVADDKAIYRYVERIIKYYLDEDAIIPNVPTYICSDEKDRKYVLEHLSELVVKATDGAGGYGMLIGPPLDARGSTGLRGPHQQESARLHCPTNALAFARPDHHRRPVRKSPRRFAARTCCTVRTSTCNPGASRASRSRKGPWW